MVVATLYGFPEAHAAKVFLQENAKFSGLMQAHFDAQSRQTRVVGNVTPNLCFSLVLPQEWRSTAGDMKMRLKSVLSNAVLTVNLRSSQELRGFPQADLAGRDAALLQQDYESLLGRPAQSVSLDSLSAEATRWSATWIDAYLPAGSMTVEAFIIPLPENSVLELSFSDVGEKEEYGSLVRTVLNTLRHARTCSEHPRL